MITTTKRTVGSSHGPNTGSSGADPSSGIQLNRPGQSSGSTNQMGSGGQTRQSIRSHSPGQNNFMQHPQQKAVKIQKAQITSNTGVFGTNNIMFGNFSGGNQNAQTGVLSSSGTNAPFQVKKQRG